MEDLQLSVVNETATVTIHRPDKRNALTQEMWDELAVLAERAGRDESVRVLVIRSDVAGVFSSGADLDEYRHFAGNVQWGMASQARLTRALAAIRAVPVPTIAVIAGACVGGGSGIALACDFRIASTAAIFAIPPARLGLIFPHEDITTLVDVIGPAAAKRMLFTAGRFDAAWALRVGLVDERHEPADLEPAVDELVAQLRAVAPGSVRSMKHIVGLIGRGVRESTAETDQLIEASLRSDDHREGVGAFLEGRRADFSRTRSTG